MWNENEGRRKKGSIQQVWFAGVHSNVGGGYPKQGMSYCSLYWMMANVKELDLYFETDALDEARQKADVNDKLYDSRSGLAFYYRYRPRDIDAICQKNCANGKARIHSSVLERVDAFTLNYAPGNFPVDFSLVTTDPSELPPGLDKNSLQQLKEDIIKHRQNPDNSRLLADAKRWILPRHYAHLAFVIASVALAIGVYYLSQHPVKIDGQGAQWVHAFFKYVGYVLPNVANKLIQPSADYLSLHPGRFVIALLIFVGLFTYPRSLRKRMTKKFIEYWGRARPLLHKQP